MNSPKQVAILLCSYNGEKYIQEQIESILSQSYPSIHLYIQDDHSKDHTWDVLQKYKHHAKVTLYQSEENLGYPDCFYDLLSKVDRADYFSFSDQDDVWRKNKIERAVHLLSESDDNKPALVYANYDICDENLNYIRTPAGPSRKPDFLYALYSCLGLGFTTVINQAARKMILNRCTAAKVSIDVWTGMCCTAFGKAYYDKEPCANHRRNMGAYSAQDTTWMQIQKERLKKYYFGNALKDEYQRIEAFYHFYEKKLPLEIKKQMDFFLDKGFFHRFIKVFFPHRLRYCFGDEIMLRIVFLLGLL